MITTLDRERLITGNSNYHWKEDLTVFIVTSW